MNRRLEFMPNNAGHAEFKFGVNYTVRLGYKWADLQVGQLVDVAKTGGAVIFKARVADVLTCKFDHVPAFVLRDHHDHNCNDVHILFSALQETYPGFKWDSEVTCVGFEDTTFKWDSEVAS